MIKKNIEIPNCYQEEDFRTINELTINQFSAQDENFIFASIWTSKYNLQQEYD